jgi:hypothetical protein
MAIAFVLLMLPLVLSTHIIGFLGWSSGYLWWLVILALLILGSGVIGARKKRLQLNAQGHDDDPFA